MKIIKHVSYVAKCTVLQNLIKLRVSLLKNITISLSINNNTLTSIVPESRLK